MIAKATKTAADVGSAIAAGATRAVDRLAGATRELLTPGTPRTPAPTAERDEDATHDDPLREDDEALEARFRALETRVRIDTSDK